MQANTLQTILLIEDDPDIQVVIKLALEFVGDYTVQTCATSREALALTSDFTPGLLLLDFMLPGDNGITTLHKLHAKPHLANTPAIFVTATTEPHTTTAIKIAGAIGIILKPFDPMTFATTIQDMWDQHIRMANPELPQKIAPSRRD